MGDDLPGIDTADDDAFFAKKYREVVGVGSARIGSRLFGARVAAGFVSNNNGAELQDMNPTDHPHAERGRRPADRAMVDRAIETYGVSLQYLLEGKISSPVDGLADRLATIQRSFHEFWERIRQEELEESEHYWPMVQRLQDIRRAASYENAVAAAVAHGWNRSTYWGHETGGSPLRVDVFIGYCLSMGARPEYGVLGIGPVRETEGVDWCERTLPHSGVPPGLATR